MLTRIAIVFGIFLLLVSYADARKKKGKSGEVKDNVYTDNKFDFKMEIPETWNISTKKDKSAVRVVLSMKRYDTPIVYTEDPSYTKVPKITVYVDSTDMKVDWFVDSIMAEDNVFKSKQKKKILEECEILYGDFIKKQKGKMSIGENEGIMVTGERQYTVQILNRSNDQADVHTDYFGGAVFFLESDGQLFVFHFICENLYFDAYYPGFVKVIEGFSLTKDN